MMCMGCGAAVAIGDNFCRYCGTPQRHVRLPSAVRDLVPVAWSPPTLWRGIAALMLGTALELLRREVTRRVADRAWLLPPQQQDAGLPDRRVVEEVIIFRRWRR